MGAPNLMSGTSVLSVHVCCYALAKIMQNSVGDAASFINTVACRLASLKIACREL